MTGPRNLAAQAADAEASLHHSDPRSAERQHLHALTFGTVLSRRAVHAQSYLRILDAHQLPTDPAARAVVEQLRAFDRVVAGEPA